MSLSPLALKSVSDPARRSSGLLGDDSVTEQFFHVQSEPVLLVQPQGSGNRGSLAVSEQSYSYGPKQDYVVAACWSDEDAILDLEHGSRRMGSQFGLSGLFG